MRCFIDGLDAESRRHKGSIYSARAGISRRIFGAKEGNKLADFQCKRGNKSARSRRLFKKLPRAAFSAQTEQILIAAARLRT
jgi:hypothetical protein